MPGAHKSLGDQILYGDSSKYYSDNQYEKTDMGMACNTYKGGENFIQGVGG
jgi:hypothetical protein